VSPILFLTVLIGEHEATGREIYCITHYVENRRDIFLVEEFFRGVIHDYNNGQNVTLE